MGVACPITRTRDAPDRCRRRLIPPSDVAVPPPRAARSAGRQSAGPSGNDRIRLGGGGHPIAENSAGGNGRESQEVVVEFGESSRLPAARIVRSAPTNPI